MFKKLRNKFILMNMTLLTTVFIGIFGVIYFFTAYSLNKDMKMQLWNSMISNGPQQQKPMIRENKMDMSIKIDLDNKNEVINIMSKLNTDDLEIDNIVQNILNDSREMSSIKINGESYEYLRKSNEFGIRIVLISKSFQQDMLLSLLRIFIMVGLLSLIILFMISVYFTNKAIEPLEESFKKQKQFIADASHELRTPLTIIKTNISILKENKQESIKSQERWISYIESQANRMSFLVNEMLSLANIDSNIKKVNLSKISLTDILKNCLLVFEVVIFEKGLLLEEYIDDDIYINGEKEQIKKLISILIDNAIKYTNSNGKIIIFLKNEKNKAKLIVKNTGEGIKNENLEKIFERFYRIDDSRNSKSGGYGLGLAIARAISEEHRGKIYAESNFGKDVSFIVEFPLIY